MNIPPSRPRVEGDPTPVVDALLPNDDDNSPPLERANVGPPFDPSNPWALLDVPAPPPPNHHRANHSRTNDAQTHNFSNNGAASADPPQATDPPTDDPPTNPPPAAVQDVLNDVAIIVPGITRTKLDMMW